MKMPSTSLPNIDNSPKVFWREMGKHPTQHDYLVDLVLAFDKWDEVKIDEYRLEDEVAVSLGQEMGLIKSRFNVESGASNPSLRYTLTEHGVRLLKSGDAPRKRLR